MPAKSQAQFRFMAAVASGKIKKPGLSPQEAHKFLRDSKGTYGKLPAMATPNPEKDNEAVANERSSDSPSVQKAEYGNKFGKNTYAGRGKKPAKGKKMSRAEFLKMVREKKFAKKKK